MHCTRKITNDIHFIGASDRRLALFENIFPIERGVSYNSYVIMDEKTALLDSVDFAVSRQMLENLDYVLAGRELDYMIVNHMEPDHCSMIEILMNRYPKMQVVVNAKMIPMIQQFFGIDITKRAKIVAEGDTLSLGHHQLSFVMAPLVHWPEVMMTYDATDKVLFSADAFGTFGALNGALFADEVNFERDWLDEARRYYTNIVGKFGKPVQNVLKKVQGLDIEVLAPLHGPVWREDLAYILGKYNAWSSYEPEEQGVLIAYASMYGNTENAADILATSLHELGVHQVELCDVSSTHCSELISQTFKMSHLVLACPTYNGGIYPVMENFVADMKALNVQNRTVAFMENGTWAPVTAKFLRAKIEELNHMTILDQSVTIRSALKDENRAGIKQLAESIAKQITNA